MMVEEIKIHIGCALYFSGRGRENAEQRNEENYEYNFYHK